MSNSAVYEVFMFADDTTIISQGDSLSSVTSDMTNNHNKISSYSADNLLIPHPNKTKIVIFSKRSQISPFENRAPLKLNDDEVQYLESYKCLGFILDQQLTTFERDLPEDPLRPCNYEEGEIFHSE